MHATHQLKKGLRIYHAGLASRNVPWPRTEWPLRGRCNAIASQASTASSPNCSFSAPCGTLSGALWGGAACGGAWWHALWRRGSRAARSAAARLRGALGGTCGAGLVGGRCAGAPSLAAKGWAEPGRALAPERGSAWVRWRRAAVLVAVVASRGSTPPSQPASRRRSRVSRGHSEARGRGAARPRGLRRRAWSHPGKRVARGLGRLATARGSGRAARESSTGGAERARETLRGRMRAWEAARRVWRPNCPRGRRCRARRSEDGEARGVPRGARRGQRGRIPRSARGASHEGCRPTHPVGTHLDGCRRYFE